MKNDLIIKQSISVKQFLFKNIIKLNIYSQFFNKVIKFQRNFF